MKYVKPSYKIEMLETEDIMFVSGTPTPETPSQGVITDGNTTIFGSETTFSEFFESLF